MSDRAPPRRLGDRYTIYEEIASGGMATVYFGQLQGPAGFKKDVAIKQLHPHVAKQPGFADMLLDEARLAARVHHANVVPTLEVLRLGTDLYLVMEYVHGVTLSRLLARSTELSTAIPPAVAVGILVGALRGLHAAHEATSDDGSPLAIVHRDVSPQNIIVGTDGVARLLDFGVAKAVGRLQSTSDGQIKGKVAYMAPEQIRGEAVDRRTDVFAASIVLWETLAGQRLFGGATPAESMTRILHGNVLPPSSVVATLPAPLDAIVLRGLAPDPEARLPSALALANALEEAITPATAQRISDWLAEASGASLAPRRRAPLLSGEAAALVATTPLERDKVDVDRNDLSTAVFSGQEASARAARRRGWSLPMLSTAVLGGGAAMWVLMHSVSSSLGVPVPSSAGAPSAAVLGPAASALAPPTPVAPASSISASSASVTQPAAEPLPEASRTSHASRHGSAAPVAAPSKIPDVPVCHLEKRVTDGGIIVPLRVCN